MSPLLFTLLVVSQAPAEAASQAPAPAPAPASRARRVEADAAFAFGYGSRMSLGATASWAMSWRFCDRQALDCRVRTGVLGGYQNEPYGVTAAFFAPSVVSGSNHRVELFGTVGLAAGFFPSRRLVLEVDLFVGWTGLWVSGTVKNDSVGLSRGFRASAHELTFGFNYALGVRLTDHVTVLSRVVLPIPYAGVAISSYFMATLGPRITF